MLSVPRFRAISRMPARKFFILAYIIALAAVSASHGFMFFVDSRTYFAGGQYVPLLTESLALYPLSAGGVALFNLISIYFITTKRRDILALCMLSPYNILLVSNVTKEAYIFGGFVIFFIVARRSRLSRWSARSLRVASLAFLIIRPIYAVLYLVGRRRSGFFLLATAVILVWSPSWVHELSFSATELLDDRAYVGHTGRDFFNYLCVAEKRNLSELLSCLTPVIFMVPIHEDTLSFRYIPYMLLHIPLWIIIYRLSTVRRFDYWILLSLYVYIFAVSPTFGAFIRYYHPVVWFAGFYLTCGLSVRERPSSRRIHSAELAEKANMET